MVDDAAHQIFRRVSRQGKGETRVVGGRVVEVSDERVKVEIAPGLEPVWVRADGVTAENAQVDVSVGTDGRPLGAAVTGRIPFGAVLKHVGATGATILGQGIKIDQTIQELAEARARLEGMDLAIVDAAKFLPVSTLAPSSEDDGHPVGSIWRQVDESGTVVAKWVYTAEGWAPFTGAVIQGETIAAAVGVFIDAMMESLTVTGAANITEAAIGELTARIASILTLNAEQVIIGRDARFTSGGIVFYAPPADGQDPLDWENRIPIIVITPTGDVSIAVAKDGAVTAAMTPEGIVWASEGRFDALKVSGYDIADLLNRGPLGALAMTRVNNNVAISNADNDVCSVKATLHTGRLYRVTYSLGMSRSAGEIRVRTKVAWNGSSAVTIADNAQPFDGEFTSPVLFTCDEFSVPDGVDVTVTAALRTVTSGATGTLWGQDAVKGGMPRMLLEDLGVAPQIYEITAGQPPAPATQWFGPEGIVSGAGWGVRPDGSNAIDQRLTLAGYGVYGSDMAENIVYPVDLSRLNGATVRSATVVLTVAQNAPVTFRLDVGTGPTSGHVNIFNGTASSNGQMVCDIPASLHQHLVGKSALIVKPFYPGSTASYGYLGGTVGVNVIYEK